MGPSPQRIAIGDPKKKEINNKRRTRSRAGWFDAMTSDVVWRTPRPIDWPRRGLERRCHGDHQKKKKKKKTERKPTEKTSESSPKVDSIVFCCKELGPDDSMSQWRRFLFSTLFLSILRPTKTRWRLDGPAVRGWRLNQNPNEESHYTLVTRPFFLPAGAVLLSTDPQFHSETR